MRALKTDGPVWTPLVDEVAAPGRRGVGTTADSSAWLPTGDVRRADLRGIPWPHLQSLLARSLQRVPPREEAMTTALEIGAVFLSVATLLPAAMVLAAFQLGRLVTRDDEQRDAEHASAKWVLGRPSARQHVPHGRHSLPSARRHSEAAPCGAPTTSEAA